ncbi:hypothetical protein [Streptomyces sp. MAR4 CNX-425]|uniref:hypothetical protein n=1 Tax=Streptomyces sp. MAR4 CNX-425 TaxID=3406343 RepID=UPI003B50C73A
MASEVYGVEPERPGPIEHFEQTASTSQVLWAAVVLGLVICGLFALLIFGGVTKEDWQAYAIGAPLLALLIFAGRRQYRFARSPFTILLLALSAVSLLFIFMGASDEIVLNKRGYRTDAVVTEVEKHARRFPTCKLAEPDGDPIHGSVPCGDRNVGDRLTVTADPLGKVDPAEGSTDWKRVSVGFAVCIYLIMFSTVLGAAQGIHRRGTIRRWSPPAAPPRNYGRPSFPFPPPPPEG